MLKKRKWPLKGWHKVTPDRIEAESIIIELGLVTRWEAKVTGAFEFETLSRKQTKTSKQKPSKERRGSPKNQGRNRRGGEKKTNSVSLRRRLSSIPP